MALLSEYRGGGGGINFHCAHQDVLSLRSPGGREPELCPELVAPGLAVAVVLSWSARLLRAERYDGVRVVRTGKNKVESAERYVKEQAVAGEDTARSGAG